MSGRNNRIVRNRDRNGNGFDLSSNSAKIIIGILVAVFFVVMIILICSKVKNGKSTRRAVEDEKNINYEYFMLVSEENIGVIDKKGNEIIKAEYVQIDIPNPSKDVFICYSEDEKITVLNKAGKKILTEYEEIQIVQSTLENSETEKNVLKYKKDGLYGLLDLNGNEITEAIYNEVSSLNYRPGRILVKKDKKCGLLDSQGNVILDVKYDEIIADGYWSLENSYKNTGYIVSEKSDEGVSFGYIDYSGDVILDTKYESIERALEYDEDDIYLIAMQKGKKGVFRNKKKIINFNFQDINYSDLSNVFIVDKNGKYGFYNLSGKAILKPEYTKYSIAGNYISVEKKGKTQLFDINGNLVNTNSYTRMIETENPSYFIAEDEEGYYSIISKDINIDEKYIQIQYAFDNYFIFTDENSKTGVLNALTNDIEIKPIYDFIILIEGTKALQAIDGMNDLVDIYSKDLIKTVTMEGGIIETLESGYSIVYSETDMKHIDKEGKIVSNTDVYRDKKLYSVQKGDKWGFVDSNKNVMVKCDYDIVTEFNKYGFAGIKKDGKWGVVNDEGKIIVKPSYELDTYYFPQFIGKYMLIQAEITYCEEL